MGSRRPLRHSPRKTTQPHHPLLNTSINAHVGAKAVLYLASDESVWTVGAEIVVDGGRMLNG